MSNVQELIEKGKQIDAQERDKAKFHRNEQGYYEEVKPFEKMHLNTGKAKDKSFVMSIRLNTKEMEMLKEVKQALSQPKDSTAIKSMFYLAYYNVIHDQKTRYLMETVFKNKRNNERTGISEIE